MRLTDEEIRKLYKDKNWLIFESNFAIDRHISQATADKIKRDIQAILTDWQEDEFFDILNARVKDIEAYFDKD